MVGFSTSTFVALVYTIVVFKKKNLLLDIRCITSLSSSDKFSYLYKLGENFHLTKFSKRKIYLLVFEPFKIEFYFHQPSNKWLVLINLIDNVFYS